MAALLLVILTVIAHVSARSQPLERSASSGSHAGLQLLPAAAWGALSSAAGADDPLFRVRSLGGGSFGARTDGMTSVFGRLGVSVVAGATRLQLQPLAIADGASVQRLGATSPRARANEVSYANRFLRAWYRNGPAGLEQGFVVPRPPAGAGPIGTADAALSLRFALLSNARAVAARNGQSVTFTRLGGPALRLGSLVVTDARGRSLPSRFLLAPGQLRLSIDATGARYPIRVDPLLQAGTPLTGPGEIGAGEFGVSVAVSENGTTALVGAPHDDNSAGAVWVFVRSGSTWTQQGAKLVAGGPAEGTDCEEEPVLGSLEESECSFGASVALSGDGNIAIVGSPRDNGHKGGAWVFTRSGSTWTRESYELVGQGEIGLGHFGQQVAISADGTALLIAAPNDAYGHGAVWAFQRTGTGWAPAGEGKITPSGAAGAGYFGRGLALSPDGSTAIIGAPGDSSYRGAAWMFTSSPAGWVQQAKVSAAEEQGASRFGFTVAASEGAETVLIGAPRDNSDAGAAWVFERSGDSLIQTGRKLTGEGEVGEGQFGRTLAIAAAGSTALIGAPRDGSGHGAAWVFTHSLSGWSGEKFSADDSRGAFGASIALSADGTVPVFGEPWSQRKAGLAWAGLPPADVAGVDPAQGPAAGGTEVTITGAGFSEVTGVYFGGRAASYEVRSSSSIAARSPAGAGGSTVDITVITTRGTSESTPADRFSYTGAEAGAGSEDGVEGPSGEESSEEGFGTLGATATHRSGCRFALLSSKVVVLSRGRAAAPRLRRLGRGRCAGRLTFTVRVKDKRGKLRARAIGSRRFAIWGSKPVTVRVSLNSFGRSLLRYGHGQVRASLVVVRLAPLPARAQSASVRLRLGR